MKKKISLAVPTAAACFGVLVSLLGGCGSGGGGGGSTMSVPGQVVWAASNNGSTVLDGNGATFYFSSSNGCLYSTVNNVGPVGFCLTNINGSSGATGCTNPSTNTSCDTGSFQVWNTYPSSGSGCIAVLGAPVSQSYYGPTNGSPATTITQIQPLDVTISGNSVYIQTYKSYGSTSSNAPAPSAYAAYWNGQIPSCGGGNPYASSYTLQTAANCSNLGPVTTSSFAYTQQVTIDSIGSIVDDGTQRIWGSIDSNGNNGQFNGRPSYTQNTIEYFSIFTISSVSQSGGKWQMSGTYSSGVTPVNCGTFTGSFTLNQN